MFDGQTSVSNFNKWQSHPSKWSGQKPGVVLSTFVSLTHPPYPRGFAFRIGVQAPPLPTSLPGSSQLLSSPSLCFHPQPNTWFSTELPESSFKNINQIMLVSCPKASGGSSPWPQRAYKTLHEPCSPLHLASSAFACPFALSSWAMLGSLLGCAHPPQGPGSVLDAWNTLTLMLPGSLQHLRKCHLPDQLLYNRAPHHGPYIFLLNTQAIIFL